MAKPPAPVEGVYERVVGSGQWYARYYIDNKQVRKSFGRDHNAAVTWVEKARTVKRSGKGLLPLSAKLAVKTADELAADQAAATLVASKKGTSSFTLVPMTLTGTTFLMIWMAVLPSFGQNAARVGRRYHTDCQLGAAKA